MSRFKNSLKRAYKRIFSWRRATQPLPADFISPSSPLPSFPQHYTPRGSSATSYSSIHPSDTPSTGSVSNPDSRWYTPDDGTRGSTHPGDAPLTGPFPRPGYHGSPSTEATSGSTHWQAFSRPGVHSTPEDANASSGAPFTSPAIRPESQYTSNDGSVDLRGFPQAGNTRPRRPVNSSAGYHIPPLPEVPSFNRDSNGVITPVVPLTPLEQVEALNRAVGTFQPGYINLQLSTNELTGATLTISAANPWPNGNTSMVAAIPALEGLKQNFSMIKGFKQVHIELDANLDTPELQTYYEWLEITGCLQCSEPSPIICDIESLTWIGSHYFFDVLLKQYNMQKLKHLRMVFPQSIGQDRLKEILIHSPGLLTLDVDGVHALTSQERRTLGNLAKADPLAHYRTETNLEELTIASSGPVDAFLETLWLHRLQKFHFQVSPSPSSTLNPVSGILHQISYATVHIRGEHNGLGAYRHANPEISSRPVIEITYRGDGEDKRIVDMIKEDAGKHVHAQMRPKLHVAYDSKVHIMLCDW